MEFKVPRNSMKFKCDHLFAVVPVSSGCCLLVYFPSYSSILIFSPFTYIPSPWFLYFIIFMVAARPAAMNKMTS